LLEAMPSDVRSDLDDNDTRKQALRSASSNPLSRDAL
jgi:hypothetical protein